MASLLTRWGTGLRLIAADTNIRSPTGVLSTHFSGSCSLRAKIGRRARQIASRCALQRRMGDLISLAALRAERTMAAAGYAARGGRSPRVTFYFDLTSPWTYLAAERADRLFQGARWTPAIDLTSVG